MAEKFAENKAICQHPVVMDDDILENARKDRLVLRSVESPDGGRCVDIFRRRSDGSFGFEEYRRDPEDPRGWGPAGEFGNRTFETEDAARAAAGAAVGWFVP